MKFINTMWMCDLYVYDTVCSFSNRDGGHIFLGIKDNGSITGIAPEALDQMKKDFVTAVNNSIEKSSK